jgi:predicted transcriptional regulator
MDRQARIVAMYRSGKSSSEIARFFGFTRARAQQLLNREGIYPLLDIQKRNRKLKAAAIEMARNGVTGPEIARRLECGTAPRWIVGKQRRVCELCPARFRPYRPT